MKFLVCFTKEFELVIEAESPDAIREAMSASCESEIDDMDGGEPWTLDVYTSVHPDGPADAVATPDGFVNPTDHEAKP